MRNFEEEVNVRGEGSPEYNLANPGHAYEHISYLLKEQSGFERMHSINARSVLRSLSDNENEYDHKVWHAVKSFSLSLQLSNNPFYLTIDQGLMRYRNHMYRGQSIAFEHRAGAQRFPIAKYQFMFDEPEFHFGVLSVGYMVEDRQIKPLPIREVDQTDVPVYSRMIDIFEMLSAFKAIRL